MADPVTNDQPGDRPSYPEPRPSATEVGHTEVLHNEVPPLPGMPAALSSEASARSARGGFQVVGGRAKDKVRDVAGRASNVARQASEKASQFKGVAAERVSAWRETVRDRMPAWKQQAQDRYEVGRRRGRELATRYPLQTVAAAAAVGFVIGFAVRFLRRDRG